LVLLPALEPGRLESTSTTHPAPYERRISLCDVVHYYCWRHERDWPCCCLRRRPRRYNTNGIDVEADARNTRIVNNVVRSYTVGITVNESTSTTIAGNDFIGNSIGGLTIEDSPGTKILSNVMRGNEVVGTFMAGPKSQDAKVVGNDRQPLRP
jgi:parallel beta-helix repeat protein